MIPIFRKSFFGYFNVQCLPTCTLSFATGHVISHFLRKGKRVKPLIYHISIDFPDTVLRDIATFPFRVREVLVYKLKQKWLSVSFNHVSHTDTCQITYLNLPCLIKGIAGIVGRAALGGTASKFVCQMWNTTVLPTNDGHLTTHFS